MSENEAFWFFPFFAINMAKASFASLMALSLICAALALFKRPPVRVWLIVGALLFGAYPAFYFATYPWGI